MCVCVCVFSADSTVYTARSVYTNDFRSSRANQFVNVYPVTCKKSGDKLCNFRTFQPRVIMA